MLVVDGFLDTFDLLDAHARHLDYSGERNPEDGVVYPDISANVPAWAMAEILDKLTGLLGLPIIPRTTFFRVTTKHTAGAPHQAHTDSIMGDGTLLLYMQDGPGGTSLLRHKETGMHRTPETAAGVAVWRRDTNTPDAWEQYDICQMRANRLCVFDSRLMHRAEPIGGFGETVKDGRLVLTLFFDVDK